MTANHTPIHVDSPLVDNPTNLWEFVSDYQSSIGNDSARDIAVAYLDQNAKPCSPQRFKELVKHFTKQVRFYA